MRRSIENFVKGNGKIEEKRKEKNCYSEKLHLSYYILVVPYLDYSRKKTKTNLYHDRR